MQHKVFIANTFVKQQMLCATLSNTVKAVTCEDVLYLDFVDDAAMQATFEEWCELADAGEDGYYYTVL